MFKVDWEVDCPYDVIASYHENHEMYLSDKSSINHRKREKEKINDELKSKIKLINEKKSAFKLIGEFVDKDSQPKINDIKSKSEAYINKIKIKHKEDADKLVKKRDSELKQNKELTDKKISELPTLEKNPLGSLTNGLTPTQQILLDIEAKRQGFDSNGEAITESDGQCDAQLLELVELNSNSLSMVTDEFNQPFINLQSKFDENMQLLKKINNINIEKLSSINMEESYIVQRKKAKEYLMTRSYSDLISDLQSAEAFNGKLSWVVDMKATMYKVSSVLLFEFLVFGCVMKPIIDSGLVSMANFAGLIGLGLISYTTFMLIQEFGKICKYISLSLDYNDFKGLQEHCVTVNSERMLKSTNEQLSQLKEQSVNLFNIFHGKQQLEDSYNKKNDEINSNYESEIEKLNTSLEETIKSSQEQLDTDIKNAQDDAKKAESEFFNNKNNKESELYQLTEERNKLEEEIKLANSKMDSINRNIDLFEKNNAIFIDKMRDGDWTAIKLEEDKTYLVNDIYILKAYKSKENNDKTYFNTFKFTHQYNPVVITYNYDKEESLLNESDENSRTKHEMYSDNTTAMLMDLVYAFYFSNNKEVYSQYIVDETNYIKGSLIQDDFQRKLNIREFSNNVSGLDYAFKTMAANASRFQSSGKNIKDINRELFNKGERCEEYNIVYFVLHETTRQKLGNDILDKLLTLCQQVGFLPIIICDEKTWEKEVNNGSFYTKINDIKKCNVISFDGNNFSNK